MAEGKNGYKLSRIWFDWCFENPEKVKPIHTALYFFAIEHCNRLGWKDKFGLPTEMTKDAIGVKSWHVYIAAFNDLVEWKFFTLIEKSKNQYSSNIIALSYSDEAHNEAHNEALDKAMAKHTSKQEQSTYQSNDSINKQVTNNNKTNNNINTDWKTDFETYKSELLKVYQDLILDKDFIIQQEKYNPNIDISLSLEKAVYNYWITEAGWKKKKQSRIKTIDWKATLINAIGMNKVYKQKYQLPENNQTQNKYEYPKL